MNNDLFSFNKDPISSTLCCESHEHTQEGTFYFELAPNQKPLKPGPVRNLNPLPMMPFLFDSIVPNKSMLPPVKTKAIEIFLFPKKKEMLAQEKQKAKFQPKKKDTIDMEGITIVGDKKLENNIDLFKPALPVVKKDLNLQEKNEKVTTTEKPEEEANKIVVESTNKPNAV